MTQRRRETELSVERSLGPEGTANGSVRLSVRLEPGVDGEPPSPSEIAEALEGLKADLDALLGPPLAALPATRTDRELVELIETYRPRQRELVDVLRDDGELTPVEHGRLVEYLATSSATPRAPLPETPAPETKFDQLIAAVPISAERPPASTRPISELLRRFQIATLKQAGAVRARRQISFEEYMSLKRHFQQIEAAQPGSPR